MPSTVLRPITYAGRSISWGADHVCEIASASKLLVSPVAAWASVGFGAVAAGASIYTAYQIHKQQTVLEGIEEGLGKLRADIRSISSKIDSIDGKLDGVICSLTALHYKVDFLSALAQDIKGGVDRINDIKHLELFVQGALGHFGELAKRQQLTLENLADLEADFQSALTQLGPGRGKTDIPLPRWMVSQGDEVFRFFRVLNLFFIESHNFLSNFDPTQMRTYVPIEGKTMVVVEADDEWNAMIEFRNRYGRLDPEKQPRLRWLLSFLWEVKQARINLASSPAFAGDHVEIFLPCLPAVERGLFEKSGEVRRSSTA